MIKTDEIQNKTRQSRNDIAKKSKRGNRKRQGN